MHADNNQSQPNLSARTGAGTTLPSTGSPDLPGLVALSVWPGAMGNQVIADGMIPGFRRNPSVCHIDCH